MRVLNVRLQIESFYREYMTVFNTPSGLDKKISLDRTGLDRKMAHDAVDVFFDEFDKLVKENPE